MRQPAVPLTHPRNWVQKKSMFFATLHLPPTLDHLGLDISGFDQIGGLVSPSDFMSMIGDLFPIALCGRSSL